MKVNYLKEVFKKAAETVDFWKESQSLYKKELELCEKELVKERTKRHGLLSWVTYLMGGWNAMPTVEIGKMKNGLGTALNNLANTVSGFSVEDQIAIKEDLAKEFGEHYFILGKLVQEGKLKMAWALDGKIYEDLDDLPEDGNLGKLRIFYEVV